MKAFVDVVPSHLSRGIHRVADALKRHAPSDVEVVRYSLDADLVVLHVIGMTGLREIIADIEARGQRFAIVQYCLRTTEEPSTAAWFPLWTRAACVWSYYDLLAMLRQDQLVDVTPPCEWSSLRPYTTVELEGGAVLPWRVTLYHAPLGVDADVFRPDPITRALFGVVTSGFIAETEGVRECAEATRRAGVRQFHLGPNLQLGEHVSWGHDIADAQLAEIYSASRYVAGLRRGEGFELPAAEGLLCGARPVMFDAPHYREWFGDHAEYVPESDAATVTDAIEAILRRPTRRVTLAERTAAAARFDWARVCAGFWERIR